MSVTVRYPTMRRLRFGAFLFLAVFIAVQLGDGATALVPSAAGAPFSTAEVMVGDVHVSAFQVIGAGGAFHQVVVYDRVLVCAPCSAKFTVTESSLTVIGNGDVKTLDDDREYVLGGYHGTIGVTVHGQANFALTFNGGADRVRADP